jgi:hypothetical protein
MRATLMGFRRADLASITSEHSLRCLHGHLWRRVQEGQSMGWPAFAQSFMADMKAVAERMDELGYRAPLIDTSKVLMPEIRPKDPRAVAMTKPGRRAPLARVLELLS